MTRVSVIAEYARMLADMAEGTEAGWGIYADFLNSFLAAVDRDRGHDLTPRIEAALKAWHDDRLYADLNKDDIGGDREVLAAFIEARL